MHTKPAEVSFLRRPAAPLVLLAALFVAVSGFIHVQQWLQIYSKVPVSVPGSVVVRVGFLVNAAASMVLASSLVVTMFKWRHLAPFAVAAALAFEASALAVLIVSRVGNVFGWMESGWTNGANLTRAAEIGAMATLGLVAAVTTVLRDSRSPEAAPALVPR
ncbi:MAG: hypothetical protein H0W70_01330 [Actinobacteria bacterium]|nr:hypothetical protein [Actinomycetota bacterium]